MGKASISIAISALWNGSSQIDKAVSDFKKLDRLVSQQQSSLTQSLASSGRSWQEWGSKVHDMGTKVASVGDTISKAVTVPMVAMGTYAVKSAVDFDTALANLRKTSDLTSGQLEEMAQSALELSTTQPVDAQTILNVEALGAQLGISNERLESFAQTVTGLDIATNMDAETAATEMARFANIVGMSEAEFQNYGSTLVAIGNNMATTESEVSQMAQRFASAGHQAGLSEAEILGLSASMSSLGIKAEMGGSALSQVFVSISKAVAMGGENLDEFAAAANMSAEEFRAAWQDNAASAFTTLLQSIHDASEAGTDMNVILGKLGITQIRQSDVMRRMAGSVDNVTEALELSTTAWEENTALQTEVDQRNESLASRLQVLKNKVEEVAITVGRPLADAITSALEAADPLIQAVSDAAHAFAEMDEEGQQNILMWAGIAAAAGPVLSVLGRVMQGVGNLASAFGRAQSAVAVYGDAMGTLDGAHLRVYSSTDKLATNLGVAKNRAVEAAGGVDKYVSAWEQMYDASKRVSSADQQLTSTNKALEGATGKTRAALQKKVTALESEIKVAQESFVQNGKLVSAYGRSTSEAEKYAKGIKGLEGSMKTIKAEFGSVETASGKMSKGFGSSMKSMASGAGSFVKNAASMGAAILGSAGPMIAVTALTAGVGYLITKWQEAEAHANLVADATQSAGEIMGAAKAGAEGLGDSIGSMAIDSDATLQSLADLNASVQDTFLSVEKDQAKLDQYVSVINELANQSGLTATEQWRLQQAVEGYNSITGDSIAVTDAANGKIADGTGELMDNTDQINANAEAWRQRATSQAYSNLASQYIEAEAEASYKLKNAEDQLATATERHNELKQKGTGYTTEEWNEMANLKKTIDELTPKVDDLRESQQTAAESSKYFSDMAQISASTLGNDLKNSLQGLPQEVSSVAVSMTDSFAAGIEAGTLTAEQAMQFLASGAVQQVSTMPQEMQPYGQAAATAISDALANGQISVEAASWLLKDAATRDISTWPAMFASAGVEMPEALASAISSSSSLPQASVSEMMSLVAFKLTNGDVEASAAMCGGNIDEGLAQAIADGTLAQDKAEYLGEEVINKLREGVGAHSPSVKAAEVGNDVNDGIKQGIEGNQEGPLTAVQSLGQSLIDGFGDLVSVFTGKGSEASSGMALGISSAAPSVTAASSGLGLAAQSGVFGVPGSLSSTGASAGLGFSSGLSSATGSANGAAAGLSNAATGQTEGVPAELTGFGTEAGNGFSSGLSSAIGSSKRAGESLAAGAEGGTSGTPGELSGFGSSASRGFASGLIVSLTTAVSNAASMASAAAGMNVGNSYQWGSHLSSNFASGIMAGLGWVSSAASAIANAAKSILHFSVPEDGPWSGAERGGERSGLHLAQNWARGIEAGAPMVAAASSRLARSAAAGLGAPVPRHATGRCGQSGSGQVTNNYVVNIDGARLQSSSPHAMELIRELFGEFNLTAETGVM